MADPASVPPIVSERIEDAGIILCRCRPEHLPPIREAALESKAQLQSWMPRLLDRYLDEQGADLLAQEVEAWDRGEAYNFAIVDRASGRVLGVAWISQIDRVNLRANLGYWTRTGATRNGVATAAAKSIARFALQELGLERVEILMVPENLPSKRVAEKIGAAFEGVLRNRFRLNGDQRDGLSFSLTKEDF